MKTIAEGALPFLMGAFFPALFAEMVVRSRILEALKQRHRQVWETLGSPALLSHASPRDAVSFLRFVWSRDIDGLSDPEVARLARTWRALQMIEGSIVLVGGVLVVSLITQV